MALDMRFDSRLVDRNLRRGIITQEEYDAYIEGLKDVEDQAAKVELEQPLFAEPDEEEDDEDGDDS